MKLATNVPRTNWILLSRMKFRSRRGPNCEDARLRATMVMEKVTPVTVIMDAAMVDKIDRAPSGLTKVKKPKKLK
jgi:hypothetical protein